MNIFKGVQRWITKNPNVNSATVLGLVRFPGMLFSDLFTTVKKSGLLNSDQLLQALEDKTKGFFIKRENNFKDSTVSDSELLLFSEYEEISVINFTSDDDTSFY